MARRSTCNRSRNRRALAGALAVALATAALAGCNGATRFVHPEADLPFYQSVGVVPFTSLAQDRLGGEKVTNVFFTELLNLHFDHVIEPGQFATAMTRTRGGTPFTNAWSTEELQKLGQEAGVQGIFMGTVRDYDMTHSGRESFPLLSLEVRLIDAATGRLVWSASETRRGGPALPFFGWTEVHTMGELTAAVCRQLLRTLPRG